MWFFNLDSQAWLAKDIVIVNEGKEIDGKVTVEAVLYGSKKVGDELEFPDLAELADPEKRILSSSTGMLGIRPFGVLNPDLPIDSIERKEPRKFEGRRMILFLGGGGAEIAPRAIPPGILDSSPPPPPEGDQHPIIRNVAWIAEGQVIGAYGRFDSPGYEFQELRLSIEEARSQIGRITEARDRIRRCEEMADPKERAREVAPLLRSGLHRAVQTGFRILVDCGADAIPHLLAHLGLNGTDEHYFLAEVMSQGGKAEAKDGSLAAFAPVLLDLADRDIAAWKLIAPALAENWYNEVENEERFVMQRRLDKTIMIVRSLAVAETPETRQKIAEIRDFCKSQPRLMEENGPNTLYRFCLAKLGEIPVRR